MKRTRVLVAVGALLGAAWPLAAQKPAPVDLVVAATTDVHGYLRGWDYYTNRPDSARGLSRAATIVDSLRTANPGRVVLLDAGDLLQGSPLAYVAARMHPEQPSPVIAAMNVMRYDAAAVGNHEFNYGVPELRRAIAQAAFPFLAANAVRTTTGAHAFESWTIVERRGVKIGIVGATTPGSDLWDRDNLAAAHLTVRDAVPAIDDAVRAVRAHGADVVLVTLHAGLDEPSSYDTAGTGVASENVAARVAHEVPGIDLIVYGHSHKEMADTVIGGALLMQPRNWAASVAVAHLELQRAAGRWTVARKSSRIIRAAGHAEDPRVLAATADMHRLTVAYVTAPIGSTPVAWRADSARVVDTPLLDFILDVERRAAGTDLASTAAFSLGASLGAGNITVAELAALYPYDNTLRAVRITGAQLREYLEQSARYYRTLGTGGSLVDQSVPGYNFDVVSGVDYVIDLSMPAGRRITSLTRNGRPVTPTDTFTMALNNYRQTGGGGYAMLDGAPVVYDRQQDIRQLLIDEVRRRHVLRPQDYAARNWRLEPAAAVGEAYRAMHRPPAQGSR